MGKTTEETSRRAKEAKGIWRKTLSFLMALLILFSISASALVERDPSEAQPAFAEQGESGVPPRLRLTPDGSGVELIFDERFTNRVDDFEQGESGVPPRLRLTPDGSGVKLVFDEGFTNRAEGFERIIERRAMPDGEKLYVILNPLLDCMVYDERGFEPFSQVGPRITAPSQNQIIVETQNFPARWDPFPGATSYLVSLRNITTNALPVDRVNVGNTTTFSIPSRYLYPGNHYRLAVAAVVGGQPIWTNPYRYFSVVPRTGEITIWYNGNGHTGGSPPPSHTVTTPGLGILRCPTRYGNMTRAGYTFGGWRLPGAGHVVQPGMGVLWESGFSGDFTVTAIWNRNNNMLNVPVIHRPTHNQILPWADVYIDWTPSNGATYRISLQRLDTLGMVINNFNLGTLSSIILDRGIVAPGVHYRLTISATLGGHTEWYARYFSIGGSNILNIPVIQRPTHNQILPWADVYIDWTPSNGATYRISLQRLDTLGMVINNFNLGTLSSIILDRGIVVPGVHYRLTISATLGGRTEWYTRYFSIAGQVTITWQGNGGSPAVATWQRAPGTTLGSLPQNPTRTNHAFAGWWTTSAATSGAQITANTVVPNANVTYWARWNSRVTFNANGGFMSASSLTNDILYDVGINDYDGYHTYLQNEDYFPSSELGMIFDNNEHAQLYTFDYFDQSFDSDDISAQAAGMISLIRYVPSNTIFGATFRYLPEPMQRAGFEFVGWYDTQAATGGRRMQIEDTINGHVTRWARWRPARLTTSAPPRPSGSTTSDSLTVHAIAAPIGWRTEYRIRLAPNGTWSDWQSSTEFDRLAASTYHQVQAIFIAINQNTHADSDVSLPSFNIRTAAAVATPSISVSRNGVELTYLDFGERQLGYIGLSVVILRVTNNGTQNVRLNAPVAQGWRIVLPGNWTTEDLMPGQSRDFSVRPEYGLVVGSHNRPLTITGTGGASATVQLRFRVTSIPHVTMNYDLWVNHAGYYILNTMAAEVESVKQFFSNMFAINLVKRASGTTSALNQSAGCEKEIHLGCSIACYPTLSRCWYGHHRSADRLVGARAGPAFSFVNFGLCSWQNGNGHMHVAGVASGVGGNTMIMTYHTCARTGIIVHEISHMLGAPCPLSGGTCVSGSPCVMSNPELWHNEWCNNCMRAIFDNRRNRN